MANITVLQPSDYLKDSRTIINTNFANLNAAVSALSAGGGNINTYNVSVSSGGLYNGVPNDLLTLKAAAVNVGTTNPLLNGNITLSANNGYVILETDGTGAQIKDNLKGNSIAGTWLTLTRVNPNSAFPINEGPVYLIKDAVRWPRSNLRNEALQLYGNRKDSSISITSFTGYNNTIPGIYVPSVSSAINYGSKVELVGPNGAQTKQLLVGYAPLYGNFDTSALSANNILISPTDSETISLSAYRFVKTLATQHLVGTSNTAFNGNITLSANNGYVIVDTAGAGTILKDDLKGNSIAGTWLTFSRVNPNSAFPINEGPVYLIKDAVQWPKAGQSNEGLQIYGNRKDSSISITSFTGYNNTIPGVYIPSLSSVNNYDSKVELVGPNGALTRVLTVGNQPFYGAPDNVITPNVSANNIIIYPEIFGGIGVNDQMMTLSAYDAARIVGSHIIVGTSNPTHNGNIALSANNGYLQLLSKGAGTQLIDDCGGNVYGGNWLEFYRTNTYPGILSGTVYIIGDRTWWPRNGNFDNQGLTLYGTLSSTSISITSGPGYNDIIPGMYIPSRIAAASGYKIELLGQNGILARKVTVGNEELYEFGITPASAANVATYLDSSTCTVVMSALEPTTSITIAAGNKGKIDLKSAGFGVGAEKHRYISVEGRTLKVVTLSSGGPAQLQINSSVPGNAGLYLLQDPSDTYGYELKPYGLMYPTYPAGSGAYYGRGLTLRSSEADLLLSTISTSAFSATNIKLMPDHDGYVSFSLLSGTNSSSTSSVSLKIFRENDTIVLDANPDVYPTPGVGYADLKIVNSNKSYGVQIPKLQADYIHNYNSGSITLSARDTGNIILVPASSAENVWIQEGRLKFPDGTVQITAYTGLSSGTGASGYSGFNGLSGYSGYSGFNGTTGASGYSGLNGAAGASGFSGYSGLNGISGYSGLVGASGYSGFNGTTGASGYSGLNGAAGASGFSGYSGATGASGYSGAIAANTDFNMGTGSLTATNGYFTGKLKLEQAQESFAVYNTAIGASTVNLDCATNNVWYITSSVSQNWTVNLQNTSVDSLYASNVVLLINQGATPYIPNALQLDGNAQSINWQGGSAPSGNANKKDSVSFTILNNSGTYIVLGQLVTFG